MFSSNPCPNSLRSLSCFGLLLLLITAASVASCDTPPLGYQAVNRDAFPVFDDPRMLGAGEAESTGAIYARDAVIGVTHKGEAKAYPITVMGIHELGNDTIGGLPIAVSW